MALAMHRSGALCITLLAQKRWGGGKLEASFLNYFKTYMSEKSLPKLSERERDLIRKRTIIDARILQTNGGEIREDSAIHAPEGVVEIARKEMAEQLINNYKETAVIKEKGITMQVSFNPDLHGQAFRFDSGWEEPEDKGFMLTIKQDAKHTKSGEDEEDKKFLCDVTKDNSGNKEAKRLFENYKKMAESEKTNNLQDLVEQINKAEEREYVKRCITDNAEKVLGKNDSFSGEYPGSFYNFKVDVSREKAGAIKIVVKETGGRKASASFLIDNDSGFKAMVDQTYTGMPIHLSEILEYFTKE